MKLPAKSGQFFYGAASGDEIEVVSKKADDGCSGVNFERLVFMEMMDKIRTGQMNCVIVKDLSRFGRNYIEVGKYIERVFPFIGVWFIAINDSYDSKDLLTEMETKKNWQK